MPDKICPKCGVAVNAMGLAGHLRFKHKVKPGKPLKEIMQGAKPHDYPLVVEWMDKLREIEERARELCWLYRNKRMPISRAELDKLLETLSDEWVRVVRESGVTIDDSNKGRVDPREAAQRRFVYSEEPAKGGKLFEMFKGSFENAAREYEAKMRAKHG